jgi:hypothetical protein
MPQGYYTIEQWKSPKKGEACEWVEILQLPFGRSLTEAEQALKNLDKAGLYRILQMQRVVWAERENDDLRMRKSHASSDGSLQEICQMFERTAGRYPVEEVKEARQQQKNRLQDNR